MSTQIDTISTVYYALAGYNSTARIYLSNILSLSIRLQLILCNVFTINMHLHAIPTQQEYKWAEYIIIRISVLCILQYQLGRVSVRR